MITIVVGQNNACMINAGFHKTQNSTRIMMPLKSSSRQKMIVGVGHHHFVEPSGGPLGGSHPDWLDDLENCWADDNEHKESLNWKYFVTYGGKLITQFFTYNQLRTDGVFIFSLGGFHHLSSLGHVLGVLLVGLPHLRSAGHLGGFGVVVDGVTSVGRLSEICCSSACLLDGCCWNCQHNINCD